MEMKSTDQATLYPSLESINALVPEGGGGETFRLHKINEILKILEAERDRRSSLAKKYQRGIIVLTGLSHGCEAATIALGTAGVALLTTADTIVVDEEKR
jgi:hypothetical protein